MGVIAIYAVLIGLSVYVVSSWVRWFRTDVKLTNPKWRTVIATLGFVASTASLAAITALSVHAILTGGFPYYHPVLVLGFRVGFLTAACGLIAALIGTGQLKVPAISCSLLCLLIWFVTAMAQ